MQTFLRKYGVQTTLHFVLYEIDGVDLRVDAADGGTDCSMMKDEGAQATCDNDFADEGSGYSLVLTATEMEAAEILVFVVDSAAKVWLDETLKIETYGNASAMHAMDFDDAVHGGLTALPNAAASAAGGLPVDTDLAAASDIVDEWETQSQNDPTGFHVNTKEVNGTAQTAGDIAALIAALNDPTAAAVATQVSTNMSLLKNSTGSGDLLFTMRDSTNHDLATSKTVSGQVSIDGGAFGPVTGSITEISLGWYKLAANATDRNGDMLAFHFTAAGCDPTVIAVMTGE